ncbi:PTS sugar transporter subunit IIA [Leuconostoc rapi]|uniref:PTS sugar transporter subunit IIA n=1 Tax=Leuconostoc rapi TaxID=1406906 RepID=UPI001959D161|nr:PTS sugar transporter subunit IIA [Leuconostoc rapi]MBM7435513.1 mannitol/fructose-specific phosphotransferase system IIA component (Ntr-type) [Leuconostoc rapi]
MDKYIFVEAKNNIDLAAIVSEKFKLDRHVVQQALTDRNKLGNLAIAFDINLPHVEIENISNQGIMWIKFKTHYELVMIVDKNVPSENVRRILSQMLNDNGLQKMRNIKNQQNLDQIVKEVLKNVRR